MKLSIRRKLIFSIVLLIVFFYLGFAWAGYDAIETNKLYLKPTTGTSRMLIRPPTLSSNITLTMPPTVGTLNQVMVTDGAGNLSFVNGGSPPGGVTGNVQYNNGGAFAGTNNLFWDIANARLGIGTTTPLTKLHVESNDANDGLRVVTANAGEGAQLDFYTSGGNLATKTDSLNGQVLGDIFFRGYASSTVRTGALIRGYQSGTHVSNSSPTDLVFYTGDGTNFIDEKMKITSNGKIRMGWTGAGPTAVLNVNGSTDSLAALIYNYSNSGGVATIARIGDDSGFGAVTTRTVLDVYQNTNTSNSGTLINANTSMLGEIFKVLSNGIVTIKNQLSMIGTTSGQVNITVPASITTHTITMPSAQGAPSTVLTNNGSGGLSWGPGAAASAPPGMVITYAGTNCPAGYQMMYGQGLSTTTYAALFAAIGYTYGGSGATFTLPDMRGRAAFGRDNMGGAAVNRITAGGSGITGTSMGAVGGQENRVLSTANMAAHTHGMNSHTHGYGGHWSNDSASNVGAPYGDGSGNTYQDNIGQYWNPTGTATNNTISTDTNHQHNSVTGTWGTGNLDTTYPYLGFVTPWGDISQYVLGSTSGLGPGNMDRGRSGYKLTNSSHAHQEAMYAHRHYIQARTSAGPSNPNTDNGTGTATAAITQNPTLILNYCIKE